MKRFLAVQIAMITCVGATGLSAAPVSDEMTKAVMRAVSPPAINPPNP